MWLNAKEDFCTTYNIGGLAEGLVKSRWKDSMCFFLLIVLLPHDSASVSNKECTRQKTKTTLTRRAHLFHVLCSPWTFELGILFFPEFFFPVCLCAPKGTHHFPRGCRSSSQCMSNPYCKLKRLAQKHHLHHRNQRLYFQTTFILLYWVTTSFKRFDSNYRCLIKNRKYVSAVLWSPNKMERFSPIFWVKEIKPEFWGAVQLPFDLRIRAMDCSSLS